MPIHFVKKKEENAVLYYKMVGPTPFRVIPRGIEKWLPFVSNFPSCLLLNRVQECTS